MLKSKSLQIFADKIRLASIQAMASFGGGHVGGVLSLSELMAVLYGKILKYRADNPQWEDRDRLILSKGHCGPALYATLALSGFFDESLLLTLNQDGSSLPSHCNMYDTPGVDCGTGSLGQGSSIAAGIALGMKVSGRPNYTYLILGDGECDEGQVWEMVLFAAHHRLDNLIAFVDMNHQQLDGNTDSICDLGDLVEKFQSFNWNATKVDGHDVDAIEVAILQAQEQHTKPSVIVLDTIKGKGWSYSEGTYPNHHMTISPNQLIQAEQEISNRIAVLETM